MKTLLAAVALAAFALPALAQDAPRKTAKPREEPRCLSENWPLPKPGEGEAYAIDGDTVAVVGLKPHIRLWGIQAPELRKKETPGATAIETKLGMVGRAVLEDELQKVGHRIHYEPTKWDRYCRIVALVWINPAKIVGSMDLGSLMLSKGAAYGFYLDDVIADRPGLSREYATAEAFAREMRVGMWREWLGEK